MRKEARLNFRLDKVQHFRLVTEASRRGVTPSNLLRQLVEAGQASGWGAQVDEGDPSGTIQIDAITKGGTVR